MRGTRKSLSKVLELLEPRQMLSAAVIGYYEGWNTPVSEVNFHNITQLDYVSVVGNSDGSIDTTHIDTQDMPGVITAAHAAGDKVSLLIDKNTSYEAIETNSTALSTFVTNVITYAKNNKFDGIDLDWEPEFPGPNQTQINEFGTMINAFHAQTLANSMQLSAAVSPVYHVIPQANLGQLNTIEVMDYDMALGPDTADTTDSENNLSAWQTYGASKSQLVMGVPFYGRDDASWDDPTKTYQEMIDDAKTGGVAAPGSSDKFQDPVDGKTYYYNSPSTLTTKANYIKTNSYGGMAMWILDGDTFTGTNNFGVLSQTIANVLLPTSGGGGGGGGGGGTATAVIVDDPAATKVGSWTSGTSTSGFYGSDYLSDGNTGKGTKSVTFTPTLAAGSYQVFARWTAASSRATNVPFDVISTSGTTTVTENEQINGGKWVSLGTFPFSAGTNGKVTIRNTATNGYVIADAVEFVPATATTQVPATPTNLAATSVTSSGLTLTWKENTTIPVSGFFLEQQSGSSAWVTVGNAAGTATSGTISGLSASTAYNFRVVAWNSAGNSGNAQIGPITTSAASAGPIIVDDTAATKTGSWTSGSSTSGFYGSDYLSDGNTGKGTKSVTYTPTLPTTGTYKVYARWTAASSRATNVPIDIVHQGTTSTVTVNQQVNGGVWVLLGTYTFSAGKSSSVTIRTTGTNGYVIADAVEFVPA